MDSATDSPNRCKQCYFVPGDWNDQDTANTFRDAADLVRRWRAPLADDRLNDRAQPDTRSVAECTDQLRESLWICRFLIEVAINEPGQDLGSVAGPRSSVRQRVLDFRACLDALAVESRALHSTLSKAGSADWESIINLNGRSHSVREVSRRYLHELWHQLADIAATGRALGRPCPDQEGVVTQISVSEGGVPKTAVESAEIGRRGLAGDVQSTRRHHGRPWQAVCLWSSDVIAALVDEGHSITPGAAGENITISGIDWASLHAGTFISIGAATFQLSAPTSPCFKIKGWFVGEDSTRIDHDAHPGFSRWYASVIAPGMINIGDAVRVGQTHGQ